MTAPTMAHPTPIAVLADSVRFTGLVRDAGLLRILAADPGWRRDIALWCAHHDNNEEINSAIRYAALAAVVPDLPASERMLRYAELRHRVAAREVARTMGAPWDEVDVDHDEWVGRALDELFAGGEPS